MKEELRRLNTDAAQLSNRNVDSLPLGLRELSRLISFSLTVSRESREVMKRPAEMRSTPTEPGDGKHSSDLVKEQRRQWEQVSAVMMRVRLIREECLKVRTVRRLVISSKNRMKMDKMMV